ncbi:HEAT domain containing protein [Halorhabdus utahensis DSM 12940]|uniref:HEAT domain containing protein n=1 Tax=Halorhabdus utahensis (strain DSM 12940 / JCM 11049 / AX-2) TaxID=519442 RepID=C7NQZ1_HALUD|nr:HEAT repeat domain-containing protein [Halorhabdus utahensis]ACV11895.1 HEAT domain containing protein [Halorhabdus utahensis DSM 12940]
MSVSTDLLERCWEHPSSLDYEDTDRLVKVLKGSDSETRRTIAKALCEVSKENREAVQPIVGNIFAFLRESNADDQIRIDLTRAISEGTAADPERFDHGDLRTLKQLLLDDNRWVRHSAAWTTELVAFGRSSKIFIWEEMLSDLLRDPHPSVRKHCCRALAHLERVGGLDSSHVDTVCLLLTDDEPEVRTAATIALGAIGSEAAIETLRTHEDPDADVAIDTQHALREATFPRHTVTRWGADFTSLQVGDWISIRTKAPVRTGHLRGKVIDVGTSDTRTVTAKNPYEGYSFTLVQQNSSIRWTMDDRRTSDSLHSLVTGLGRVHPIQISLMYAVEGDKMTVDFGADTRTFDIITVDSGAENFCVVGTDGEWTVTFRLSGTAPFVTSQNDGHRLPIAGIELRAFDIDKSTVG